MGLLRMSFFFLSILSPRGSFGCLFCVTFDIFMVFLFKTMIMKFDQRFGFCFFDQLGQFGRLFGAIKYLGHDCLST